MQSKPLNNGPHYMPTMKSALEPMCGVIRSTSHDIFRAGSRTFFPGRKDGRRRALGREHAKNQLRKSYIALLHVHRSRLGNCCITKSWITQMRTLSPTGSEDRQSKESL